MALIGRGDLAADPALADNAGRVARVDELDQAIGEWTRQRTVDEVLGELEAASVPAGRIYTVEDIAKDPHYLARGMLEKVRMEDGTELSVPGVVPKLSRSPGSRDRAAPRLGQDTRAVLRDVGLGEDQIQQLIERGIVEEH